jgi:hypothetical protein
MTTPTLYLNGNVPIAIYSDEKLALSLLARQAYGHLATTHNLWPKQAPKPDTNLLTFGAFGPDQSFWSAQIIPHLPASLSHTMPGIGAAIIDRFAAYLGVGLDIEWSDRETKPGIDRWMGINQQIELRPIETWAIKEAIYKAAQARFQTLGFGDVLPFKRIHLRPGTFNIELENATWTGDWQIETFSLHQRKLLVARAYLKVAAAKS